MRGKVTDVERTVTDGFTVGQARLRPDGGGDAGEVTIRFQNENLVATRDGAVLTIVPDLICVVEAETYEPITAERLRYGQRVQVLAIGTPDIMRSGAALRIFGPRAFGLASDYVPVENLVTATSEK
jgi:DUF917 family protein